MQPNPSESDFMNTPNGGEDSEVESELSNYSEHTRKTRRERNLYHDNTEGDPNKVNQGYVIRSLDPEIFGQKKVDQQRQRNL